MPDFLKNKLGKCLTRSGIASLENSLAASYKVKHASICSRTQQPHTQVFTQEKKREGGHVSTKDLDKSLHSNVIHNSLK